MSNFQLPKALDGLRLDKALARLVDKISRSQIQKAIKTAQVRVNDVIISDSALKVKEGDIISIACSTQESFPMNPANIKLNIIYEDEDLIVLNKEAGMTVHPGAGNHHDTLANALLHHANSWSNIGGLERPGIVHRLDKDTSGLMVVAKNNFTHANLANQIETRHLIRKYKALVWGIINPQIGIIHNNIGRSRINRKKMTIVKWGGKEAITYYNTKATFYGGLISMIICKLATGRTHQIRVQLSHLKHSVVGDQIYGHNNRKVSNCVLEVQRKLTNFKRQALHSDYISFTHPRTGQLLEFESLLPQDILEIIDSII